MGVTESNELVRIKGVEAATLFVQNAPVSCASKTCSEVLAGIVKKCFNSKPKTKETAINLCLMYIEIDKQETVFEELLTGFENKQPKVVLACIEAVTLALSLFGHKVVPVKKVIKSFVNKDKNVRTAAKVLFIELYNWLKEGIRASIQGLNAVVVKELEAEWEKVTGKPEQTRFMRSQHKLREAYESKQTKQRRVNDDNDEGDEEGAGGDDCDEDEEEEEEIDPYDLADPVEVLSKLPKNFYEQIESKLWKERKEMLVEAESLTKHIKLMPGDYHDFLKTIKKVVTKDTNVLLMATAVKIIGQLAAGLRGKFQPYAVQCLEAMFSRYKEKKPSILEELVKSSDLAFDSTNMDKVQDSIIEFLAHKVPLVRAQVGCFLSRSLRKLKADAFNKTFLKAILPPLLKNLDHGTADVRDGSYQAIAVCCMKISEDKVLPFLGDLPKVKLDKLREAISKLKPEDSKAEKPVKQVKVVKPAAKKEKEGKKPAPSAGPVASKKTVRGGAKKSARGGGGGS